MIKSDFAGTSGALGLKNASCTFALIFTDPENASAFTDDFFLFIPVGFAESLVDKNDSALHVGNIDTIVGAHNGTGKQLELLFDLKRTPGGN